MNELTRGSSSHNQLIQSNACRLYLNVIHLSDIVNPDEKKPDYLSSKLKWLHQKYPSVKAWKLWNTKIRKEFNIQDNQMLKPFSLLGKWLAPESQRNMTDQ